MGCWRAIDTRRFSLTVTSSWNIILRELFWMRVKSFHNVTSDHLTDSVMLFYIYIRVAVRKIWSASAWLLCWRNTADLKSLSLWAQDFIKFEINYPCYSLLPLFLSFLALFLFSFHLFLDLMRAVCCVLAGALQIIHWNL